jgi:hypothetical protein
VDSELATRIHRCRYQKCSRLFYRKPMEKFYAGGVHCSQKCKRAHSKRSLDAVRHEANLTGLMEAVCDADDLHRSNPKKYPDTGKDGKRGTLAILIRDIAVKKYGLTPQFAGRDLNLEAAMERLEREGRL